MHLQNICMIKLIHGQVEHFECIWQTTTFYVSDSWQYKEGLKYSCKQNIYKGSRHRSHIEWDRSSSCITKAKVLNYNLGAFVKNPYASLLLLWLYRILHYCQLWDCSFVLLVISLLGRNKLKKLTWDESKEQLLIYPYMHYSLLSPIFLQ